MTHFLRVFLSQRTVDLRRHISEVHVLGKIFNCPEMGCNQVFRRQTTLDQHARLHLNIKPFQCLWCDFTGECQSYLIVSANLMDTPEQGRLYGYPSRARVCRGSDENSNIPYDNHNVSIFVNIASNNQSITVLLFYYKTCVKEKRNQTSRNSIHFPLFIYLGKISDSKSARNCQNSW